MVERRFNQVIAGVVALVVMAVVWDKINDARRPPAPPPAPPQASQPAPDSQTQAGRAEPSVRPADNSPSYMEQLARAEERRQIRASAALTYLNDIFAKSSDSTLHRWEGRIFAPVRVYLGGGGTVANYQPAFLDAVRSAFARWQDAGVPVRFDLGADSNEAEVRLKWKVQFEIDRTGQTDLTWDAMGHHQSGVITLATFNQLGQPMGMEEIRIVAMHEIGHLLGLDHSPDSTDLMYPVARVRDLSDRDIQTARMLYQLPTGSIR